MVDLTRRKMVIGLGLLATGSGATFTSAAFAENTTPTSDIRVVVDQELIVEAAGTPDTEVTTGVSNPSQYVFGSSSDIINTTNYNFGDVETGGVAAVNGQQNGNLSFAVAAVPSETSDLQPILQVTNNGTASADVGISIASYGSGVTGGYITKSNVDTAFNFKIEDSNGTYQDVGSSTFVTIEAGDKRGIELELDLPKIDDSNLLNASNPQDPSSSPFSGGGAAVDTVDLVDTISVGVDGSQ